MIEVVDGVGRTLRFAQPVRRVVSLVPSLTESLFDLGAGSSVIGVTRYCVEPQAARELPQLGGTKNPALGEITALAPDLVLIDADENRREDFEMLQGSGLEVFVSHPRRVADVPGMLRALGVLIDRVECGERFAAQIEQSASGRSATGQRTFCPIWKNPWMGFNRETYPNDVLASIGCENVLADAPERYCLVSLEALVARNPEIILLPDEPYVFREKDLPSLEPLAETPALRGGRLHFIDGKDLCWFGTRTAGALTRLAERISA